RLLNEAVIPPPLRRREKSREVLRTPGSDALSLRHVSGMVTCCVGRDTGHLRRRTSSLVVDRIDDVGLGSRSPVCHARQSRSQEQHMGGGVERKPGGSTLVQMAYARADAAAPTPGKRTLTEQLPGADRAAPVAPTAAGASAEASVLEGRAR